MYLLCKKIKNIAKLINCRTVETTSPGDTKTLLIELLLCLKPWKPEVRGA